MHAIMEFDKGVVMGTTWHKVPSYITQDTPVTILQAIDVLKYPVEIRPNYRQDALGNFVKVPGNNHIMRTDHEVLVAAHVGDRFRAVDNDSILSFVHENVMAQYPQLKIESVGTLFNGGTAFVNLLVAKHQVYGDASPLLHRLMYYNPIGLGSYKICCHNVRVVCNNTLQMAAAQGTANESMQKVRHTATASKQINDKMVNLSQFFLELESYQESLNRLARKSLTEKAMTDFLGTVLFPTDGKSKASVTRAEERVGAIMAQHNTDQGLKPGTAWALLNAITFVTDHAQPRKGSDTTAILWDGLVGERATFKDKAYSGLMTLVAA